MMAFCLDSLSVARVRPARVWLALALPCVLSACMVGPDYVRPALETGAAYRETPGWVVADPDMASRPKGPWWEIYRDETLSGLMEQLDVNNLNIAQAEAKYRQAIAIVQGARAPLFPTITATGSLNRTGGSATSAAGVVTSTALSTYGASGGATWTLDIWGSVRRNMEGQEANKDALAASVGGARLTAQSTLALTYMQLRVLDEHIRVIAATVAAYEKALTLTQNKYDAGVANPGDVSVATTQLESTRAQLIDTEQQRALLENAMAVLLGRPPSAFSLASKPFAMITPATPVGLPSELLQQRPDVANAERLTAATNAQIGVAVAAWFPSLTVNGNVGYRTNDFLNWITAPAQYWALGPILAQTIFDGGARQSVIDQNRALFDAQVATYRLTVLQALQQVDNALVQLRVFDKEEKVQWKAVLSARESVRLAQNQYNAGLIDYLSVAVLENTAFNNENNYVTLLGNRLASSVQLIVALGGGWTTADIKKLDDVGKPIVAAEKPAVDTDKLAMDSGKPGPTSGQPPANARDPVPTH